LNEGHEQDGPSSISLHVQRLTLVYRGYERQFEHEWIKALPQRVLRNW
jgi:hypothetical protein